MSAGKVTASVSAANEAAQDRLVRQITDLQAEIASETAALALMDERRQVIVDRIAELQAKLEELV